MQKLHLVGFTTDQKGLILSPRRGARSGGFQLPLDDAIADAVEAFRARQAEEAAQAQELEASRPPVESALPVREIQPRLRQGRTVQEVAKAAGVEPEWVDRFATPVFAEQAQVVSTVQGSALRRTRLGASALSIGDAVRRNLGERGMAMSPDEFAAAWTSKQMADGRWVVRFAYRYRSKDQTLRYDLDESTGEVTAADRNSAALGYVPPAPARKAPAPDRARPVGGGGRRPAANRATVTTGFRPELATKAVSRPAKERERANAAMRKAASKRAAEGERAAARKAKEKQEEAARLAVAAEAERARKARARATAARKKAIAAKKAAADKARRKTARQAADQARRAEAALAAAEKAKAAERAAARRAAKRRSASKQVPAPPAARKQPGTRAVASPAKRPVGKRPPASAARSAVPLASRPRRVVEPARAPAPAPLPLVTVEDLASAAVRPRFRPDLAEAVDRGPEAPGLANGDGPRRPLDRPRRTRPLRAT